MLDEASLRQENCPPSSLRGGHSPTILSELQFNSSRSILNDISSQRDCSSSAASGIQLAVRMQTLAHVQLRLASLAHLFSTGLQMPENIDEIYRIMETMSGILDRSCESDVCGNFCLCDGQFLTGPVMLQFLGCYHSLLLVSSRFVQSLQANMVQVNLSDASGSSSTVCTPSVCPSPPHTGMSTSSVMPAITVGGFKLAMPRRALAEMNLHLVRQTFENLRGAMWRAAVREKASCSSTEEGVHGGVGTPQMQFVGPSSLSGFLNTAVSDLFQIEERLFKTLGVSNKE